MLPCLHISIDREESIGRKYKVSQWHIAFLWIGRSKPSLSVIFEALRQDLWQAGWLSSRRNAGIRRNFKKSL